MKPEKQSVDEIITDLPIHEQVIVKRLRLLILECLPYAREKNNYGVPFYTRNRMICFIWPPSVYWGPKKQDYANKGVTLGFCQGNLMANENNVLKAEGRKQVFCMYFKSPNDIDEKVIRSLLFEAGLIDDGFSKKRKA
ncbi:MAG: DUF1801 domain-containing protein [Cyclobacteriaceae bacterium]|nr:DUF1801 domain-containing protein [Cyclobacteriaceae bacterium]QOI96729.1 MAG: DUF1801 domain-containing protein [Flammeovirgaceae bacterium]